MVLTVNILSMIFAILAAVYASRISLLVRGRTTTVLAISFIYAALFRTAIILMSFDLIPDFPTRELFVVFYSMCALGMIGLYKDVRKYINHCE